MRGSLCDFTARIVPEEAPPHPKFKLRLNFDLSPQAGRGTKPPRSRLRHRVRKHDFDQRARTRAGLDLEFGAVGFDQRLGQ